MTDEEYLVKIYADNLYDLSRKEDCNRLKDENKNLILDEIPVFSFIMCVYNDILLLNSAINSLLKQSFKQWELIILDNSDKDEQAWRMIENAMEADKRIRGYRSQKNVGWPKGASICLEYVKGIYATFLSADDCINLESLVCMNDVLNKEKPDILWVGNAYVDYENENLVKLLGISVPQEYEVFGTDNRSQAIIKIMQNIYYNSMFHYMRVEFLRENKIDFFEPYYADCGGMTQAMAVAKKMVVYNQVVYFLTMNTSQTAGKYSWDSYEYIFVSQWKSVKDVFLKENYNNLEGIQYVAMRILKNLLGNIGPLCSGNCRDKYMNKLDKSVEEIVEQLEAIINQKEIKEMFIFAGPQWITELLQYMQTLKHWNIDIKNQLIQRSSLRRLFTLVLQETAISMEDILDIYRMIIEKDCIKKS